MVSTNQALGLVPDFSIFEQEGSNHSGPALRRCSGAASTRGVFGAAIATRQASNSRRASTSSPAADIGSIAVACKGSSLDDNVAEYWGKSTQSNGRNSDIGFGSASDEDSDAESQMDARARMPPSIQSNALGTKRGPTISHSPVSQMHHKESPMQQYRRMNNQTPTQGTTPTKILPKTKLLRGEDSQRPNSTTTPSREDALSSEAGVKVTPTNLTPTYGTSKRMSPRREPPTPMKRLHQPPPTPFRSRALSSNSILGQQNNSTSKGTSADNTISHAERSVPPRASKHTAEVLHRIQRMKSLVGDLPAVLYDVEDPLSVVRRVGNQNEKEFERVSLFDFERQLGSGAFGEVWQVRRKTDNRRFALKKMTRDLPFRAINDLLHLIRLVQAPVDGCAPYPTLLGGRLAYATLQSKATLTEVTPCSLEEMRTNTHLSLTECELSVTTMTNSSFDAEEARDVFNIAGDMSNPQLQSRSTRNQLATPEPMKTRNFPSLSGSHLAALPELSTISPALSTTSRMDRKDTSNEEDLRGSDMATPSNNVLARRRPQHETTEPVFLGSSANASMTNSSIHDVSQMLGGYDPVLDALDTIRSNDFEDDPTELSQCSLLESGRRSTQYFFGANEPVFRFFYHPNILRHYAIWVDSEGVMYIQTDLCEGTVTHLATKLAREKALSERLIWKTLGEASEGLAHLHRLSFVHRDVKPANLFYLLRCDLDRDQDATSSSKSSEWVSWPVVYSRWWLPLQAAVESELSESLPSEESTNVTSEENSPLLGAEGIDEGHQVSHYQLPSLSLPDFYLNSEFIGDATLSRLSNSQDDHPNEVSESIGLVSNDLQLASEECDAHADISMGADGDGEAASQEGGPRRRSSPPAGCEGSFFNYGHTNEQHEASPISSFGRMVSAPFRPTSEGVPSGTSLTPNCKKSPSHVPPPSSILTSKEAVELSQYVIVLGDLGSAAYFRDGLANGGSEDVDGFFMAPEALNQQLVPIDTFQTVLRKDHADTIELAWRDLKSAVAAEAWLKSKKDEGLGFLESSRETEVSNVHDNEFRPASPTTAENALMSCQRFSSLPRQGTSLDRQALSSVANALSKLASKLPDISLKIAAEDAEGLIELTSTGDARSRSGALASRLANEIRGFLQNRAGSGGYGTTEPAGSKHRTRLATSMPLFGGFYAEQDMDMLAPKSLFDHESAEPVAGLSQPSSSLLPGSVTEPERPEYEKNLKARKLGQGPWSDVFSLGVTALSLLTGREPSLVARHVRTLQRGDRDWIAEPLSIPTTVLQREYCPKFKPSFAEAIAPFLPYVLACPTEEDMEHLEQAQHNLEALRSGLVPGLPGSPALTRRGSVSEKPQPLPSSAVKAPMPTFTFSKPPLSPHPGSGMVPTPSNGSMLKRNRSASQVVAPLPRRQLSAPLCGQIVDSVMDGSAIPPAPSPVVSLSRPAFVPTPIRVRAQSIHSQTGGLPGAASSQITPRSCARVYSYACPPGSTTPLRASEAKILASTVRGAVKYGDMSVHGSSPDRNPSNCAGPTTSITKRKPSKSQVSIGVPLQTDDYSNGMKAAPFTVQPPIRTRAQTLPGSAAAAEGRPMGEGERACVPNSDYLLFDDEVRKSLMQFFNEVQGDDRAPSPPTAPGPTPNRSISKELPKRPLQVNVSDDDDDTYEGDEDAGRFAEAPSPSPTSKLSYHGVVAKQQETSQDEVICASQALADLLQTMLEPHLALRPSAPAVALACRSIVSVEAPRPWVKAAVQCIRQQHETQSDRVPDFTAQSKSLRSQTVSRGTKAIQHTPRSVRQPPRRSLSPPISLPNPALPPAYAPAVGPTIPSILDVTDEDALDATASSPSRPANGHQSPVRGAITASPLAGEVKGMVSSSRNSFYGLSASPVQDMKPRALTTPTRRSPACASPVPNKGLQG